MLYFKQNKCIKDLFKAFENIWLHQYRTKINTYYKFLISYCRYLYIVFGFRTKLKNR